MSRTASLNDPSRWLAWLRACSKDDAAPIDLPAPLHMLTGQDQRALGAIAHCWHLYASSDEDGARGALAAVRALLPAIQPECRPFARELIPQALDWHDRARLWPLAQPGTPDARVDELCRTGVLHMQDRAGRLWAVFPDGQGLTPDVAARLHQEGEAVACGFRQVVEDGELWTVLSLRSNGELDVGKLARCFGGDGGTRAADVRLCQSDPIGAVRALLGCASTEGSP